MYFNGSQGNGCRLKVRQNRGVVEGSSNSGRLEFDAAIVESISKRHPEKPCLDGVQTCISGFLVD